MSVTRISREVDLAKEREELLTEESYFSNPFFLRDTSWFCGGFIRPRSLHDANATRRKLITVVGTVTPHKLYMEPHGDFELVEDAFRTPFILSNSHLSFSIVCPKDPGFAGDFGVVKSQVNILLEMLRITNPTSTPFIQHDVDGAVMLTFRHRIFQFKYMAIGLNETSVMDTYSISAEYRPFYEQIKSTHRPKPLSLWSHEGDAIDPSNRAKVMVNKLVKVGFVLNYDMVLGLVAEVETINLLF